MLKNLLFILFVSLELPCFVFAQAPLAKRLPSENFSCVGVAKLEKLGREEFLAIRLPGWHQKIVEELYTVQVPVYKTVLEEVNKDGKIVEETREISEMVTETRTRQIAQYIAREPVKGQVTLEGLKAWDTKGKLLSKDELKKTVEKTTYILCLMQDPPEGEAPFEPFMAGALRSDLIFLYSEKMIDLYNSIVAEMPQEPGVGPR
jgi:hypothetical protein